MTSYIGTPPTELKSVKSENILDGEIVAADLSDNAVIESKISADAVTTNKIADNAVTNSKLTQVATETLKGRVSSGTGNVEDLTETQVKTFLQYVSYNESPDPITRPTIANNSTDSEHDIDITSGARLAQDKSGVLVLSSDLTKQLDASWAQGDNSGGLSSSLSISADTWYYVFLIQITDSSGTFVDVGFDTDLEAANLITDHGVEKYRRIGSILTDSSSNIIQFLQFGNSFVWLAGIQDVNSNNITVTENTYTLSVPPVPVEAKVLAQTNRAAGNSIVHLYSNYWTGVTSAINLTTASWNLGIGVAGSGATAVYGVAQLDIFMNDSTINAYPSTICDLEILTLGYKDLTI